MIDYKQICQITKSYLIDTQVVFVVQFTIRQAKFINRH